MARREFDGGSILRLQCPMQRLRRYEPMGMKLKKKREKRNHNEMDRERHLRRKRDLKRFLISHGRHTRTELPEKEVQ
jgi:hypothetical protein